MPFLCPRGVCLFYPRPESTRQGRLADVRELGVIRPFGKLIVVVILQGDLCSSGCSQHSCYILVADANHIFPFGGAHRWMPCGRLDSLGCISHRCCISHRFTRDGEQLPEPSLPFGMSGKREDTPSSCSEFGPGLWASPMGTRNDINHMPTRCSTPKQALCASPMGANNDIN